MIKEIHIKKKSEQISLNQKKMLFLNNDPFIIQIKQLTEKLEKQKEINKSHSETIQKLKEKMNEMRKNYYKEQDFSNEIKYRKSKLPIIENEQIKLFYNFSNLDYVTQRFISDKLDYLNTKYNIEIDKLASDIKNLETINVTQKEEIEYLKSTEIEFIFQRLKLFQNKPHMFWENIISYLGKSFLRQLLRKEIDEIQLNFSEIEKKFKNLEEKAFQYISEFEKLIKPFIIPDCNTNSSKIKILANELDDKEILI